VPHVFFILEFQKFDLTGNINPIIILPAVYRPWLPDNILLGESPHKFQLPQALAYSVPFCEFSGEVKIGEM